MTDAELMAGMRARKDAGSKLAADRIEQLAVTNEALIARLRELDGWVMHGAHTSCSRRPH